MKNLLECKAIQENVTCETFEQFKMQVYRTLKNVDPTIIDKAIESMPQRKYCVYVMQHIRLHLVNSLSSYVNK